VNEKGCAVLAALEAGCLSEERYHNYLRIARELAFNEMSYLEKRKKDRAFGKLIKSVMKSKKNHST
jgi:ribosome biogenesis GTPase